MKDIKRIVVLAAITVAIDALAGVGATTNWVAKYVADYVGNAISNSTGEVAANTSSVTTGEVTTVTSGTAEMPITMSITLPSIEGLIASQCDAAVASYGITNGTSWVWSNTDSRYERSGGLPIVPTSTNFLWNAIGSVSDSGDISFKDGSNTLFVVRGTYFTEAQAAQIRGN